MKVPFLLIARPGLPNAMANIFNAYRDRIPMIVSVDNVAEISRGRFGFEEIDDLTDLASPITRWSWESRRADSLPEDFRRAMKFAPPRLDRFFGLPMGSPARQTGGGRDHRSRSVFPLNGHRT